MVKSKKAFLAKRREYHKKNKDRINALARERRKSNPDRRYRDNPKRKDYVKKYYDSIKDNYNLKRKKLRKENPEKFKEAQREYYKANSQEIIKNVQKYYYKNKDKKQKYNKTYRKENIDSIKTQVKNRREQFGELLRKQARDNYAKNKDKIREKYKKNSKKITARRKELFLLNPEKTRKRQRDYLREKRKDPIFRAVDSIRRRINSALKSQNQKKSHRTFEFVGCTIPELKNHLEKKFKPGMSWDNQGMKGWQIDHIKPVSKFDLSKKSEQIKCFHYKNLQPLWWIENLKKSNR